MSYLAPQTLKSLRRIKHSISEEEAYAKGQLERRICLL